MIPPAEASPAALRGGPITEEERALWSLQPIQDPNVPEVEDASWPKSPVDRFILRRLEQAHLAPTPRADPRIWLRRVSFDLTGLPPTPAELNAFLQDSRPDAFARVVDRLLQSDAYGERWGRHWLDVVRYADTAGETGDYPIPQAFRYRNWVIQAFNEDLPYDEFLRRQIAGDLMARQGRRAADRETYADLLTATGFIAISRRFGFDVENYHYLTIQDTIDTLGQSVLGLTLGCARCHDHKYDPVNMDDYYAWYGIFESTRYSFPGSEEKKRPYDMLPAVPPAEAEALHKEHQEHQKRLETRIKELEAEQARLVQTLESAGGWPAFIGARLLTDAAAHPDGHQGFLVWRHPKGLPSAGVNVSKETLLVPGTVPPGAFVVHPDEKDGIAIAWRAIRSGSYEVTGAVADAHDCGDSVAWFLDRLHGTALMPVAQGVLDRAGRRAFAEAGAMPVLPPLTLEEGDYLQLSILPKTHYGCDLTRVEWRLRAAGTETWNWDLAADALRDFHQGGQGNPHDDRQGHQDVWAYYVVPPDRGQGWAQARPERQLTTVEHDSQAQRLEAVRAELARTMERREALRTFQPYATLYGAVEGKPVNARLQRRGDPQSAGDPVPRRNLTILGGDSIGEPDRESGRLELAGWLTRRTNPLTARVMVNRVWQHHFGHGLVRTENDFGTRGEPPTHPDLLDWLATRFMESGWSIKALHRLILNSATYQMSSEGSEAAAAVDPEVRWRWRFEPRRLSAEEFRDALLMISGTLDPAPGGEHPFPAVDTWGFTQHNPYYGLYETRKRSVYLMQQRLKRHPFLALFDGADPNASTARRMLTTTPTQALYLMNSAFVHEASTALSDRLCREVAQPERVDRLHLEILNRPPEAQERREATAFLEAYAARLHGAGVASDADRSRQALAALARTLLIRNEFLFVE